VIGNTLEVFDFIAYGTYAVMIGRTFFPARDPLASLLLSVSTFGVGFVTRPLGAALIGAYADRRGARAGMLLSLSLMGAGSLLIALLPGWRVLGLAAPLLLVLARLVQGLAWGGEAGPATIFLRESAPPGREGRFVAWQGASQAGAVLLSGVVGVLIVLALGRGGLAAGGWRVPFLMGALIVPVGLWLRRGLPDTPVPAAVAGQASPAASVGRVLACGFVLMAGGTVTQYFLNFTTSYALSVLHIPVASALQVSVVVGLAAAGGALATGALCDRFGARALTLWPRVLLALLVVPLLTLAAASRDAGLFLLVAGVIGTLQGSAFVASLVALLAALPAAARNTRFGLLYAVPITLFGGTAQIAFVWLIEATGLPTAPGWYVALANAAAACAAAGLPRAADGKTPAVLHPGTAA